jgi:hypothetical protein
MSLCAFSERFSLRRDGEPIRRSALNRPIFAWSSVFFVRIENKFAIRAARLFLSRAFVGDESRMPSQRGRRAGVFGVPTFVVQDTGKLFWGSDRVWLLRERLSGTLEHSR